MREAKGANIQWANARVGWRIAIGDASAGPPWEAGDGCKMLCRTRGAGEDRVEVRRALPVHKLVAGGKAPGKR